MAQTDLSGLKGLAFRRSLERFFAVREPLWMAGAGHDRELLAYAVMVCFTGASLFLLAGYHGAFFAVHNAALDIFPPAVWANITFLGDTESALAIAALVLLRHPRLALAVLLSAIICTVLVHVAKVGFAAVRPPAVFSVDVLEVIGPAYKSKSFPSGHTATAFVMAGLLTRLAHHWALRLGLLAVALMIGWSRVAVGVHWPVDVLLGAVIGLISAWLGLRLSDRCTLRADVFVGINAVLMLCPIILLFDQGGFMATAVTGPVFGGAVMIIWGATVWRFAGFDGDDEASAMELESEEAS